MVQDLSEEASKILVIDDERGTRESLRFALCSDFAVLTAESVDEGISYLNRQIFDAIVLDLRLPGVDGIEGLRRIRKIDRDVAVVILTAFGSLETAQAAIRCGANDYQLKPFDVKELLHVIQHHVSYSQAMRRYRALAADLQRINDNLSKRLLQLEADAYVGQVAAGMMHDFSSPFSSLNVYLEMLGNDVRNIKDKEAGEQCTKHLARAEYSLNILWDMIGSFKKLYSGRSGKYDTIEIRELLADVANIMQPNGQTRQRRLLVNEYDRKSLVVGNRLQLFRVFTNLVNNALRAVEQEEHGFIELDYRDRDDCVEVLVNDNGCGIPEPIQNHVFDRFFTTHENGTGLGLFISQTIVHSHGGKIHLDSKPGAGTTVSVMLPRAYGEDPAPSADAEQARDPLAHHTIHNQQGS